MIQNLVTNPNNVRLCRCCATERDLMHDVFYGTCSNAQTYREVIMECAPVQLFRDDGLPALVCYECVSLLESFVVFRQKCVDSELIFKRMYKNISQDEQETLGSNRVKRTGSALDTKDVSNEPETNSVSEMRPELIFRDRIKIEDTSVDENRRDTSSPTDRQVDRESIGDFVDLKEGTVKVERPCVGVDRKEEGARVPYSGIDRWLIRHFFKVKQESVESANKEGAPVYSCDRCEKSYRFKAFLDLHRRLHAGVKPYVDEKPYPCDKCSKSFDRRSYLNKHRKIHIGDKPYACDECDKSFSFKSSLDRHRYLHAGEKSRSRATAARNRSAAGATSASTGRCTRARNRTRAGNRSSTELSSTHRKTHAVVKPYACDACAKSFNCRSYLNKHRKTHAADKP